MLERKISQVQEAWCPCLKRVSLTHNMNLLKNDIKRYLLTDECHMVAGVIAVCMDPFFLYIPFLSAEDMCLGTNTILWLVAVVVRSVADLAYLSLCVSRATAELYLNMPIKSFLLMCFYCLAFAPIPQIAFSDTFIMHHMLGYTFWTWSPFCQYGTRLVLIFRLCEQLKPSLSVTTLQFKAALYFFLYLIVGHVIGASWYFLSIKRQVSCWKVACLNDSGCVGSMVHCDGTTTSLLLLNSTIFHNVCAVYPPDAIVFNYGIYFDAVESGIVGQKEVLRKFMQCFFWGLRNLSSLASNLQTSAGGEETLFASIISVVGLILLIYSIGNIQRYTELASARSERIVDKMKLIKPKIKLLVKSHNLREFTETLIVKRIQKALENDNDSFKFARLLRDDDTITESFHKDLQILETSILNPRLDIQMKVEKWLSDNNIPPDQNNILFYLKCRLEDDEDVNLKSVLSVLPYKTEWMTKKDLCFDTLKKVPRLQNIDEEWFRSMSSTLKPVIYPKGSYIFREGEPLEFIIIITNGIAWSYTTSTDAGGRVSISINSLKKGNFFGVELLEWKLDKRRELKSDRIPLSCIPISTAKVKSHTQVEALVLMINDLALCCDFPVATSKLRRIIRKQIISNADQRKRSAFSVTEGVDSSSRAEEGDSVQREIEDV